MKKFSGVQFSCHYAFNTNCNFYCKPSMKGRHRHNHARNVLERKLNKSKSSRKRCHNYLNKGYVYKFFVNRCPRRAK